MAEENSKQSPQALPNAVLDDDRASASTDKDASINSPDKATEMVEEAQAPATANVGADGKPDTTEYPPTSKAIVIMISLFLSMFLVSLDRLIVATAIPVLSDQFNSFGDIGWYGSAYLLTACSLQIFFGRLYTFFNPKWLYLSFIVIFEVGSVVCGAAPNSIAFIFGRAIAGAGSAGVQNGSVILMLHVLPLHKRPMFQGLFGAVFGISSVIGPLIGGAFTSNVTWRWCFYINLPIGGVIILINLFILNIPQGAVKKTDLNWKQQILRLDPVGTLIFIPTIVCLLLALEWGGSTYPWSNGRIIALFVCFGVGLFAYATSQILNKKNATFAGHIVKNRNVLGGAWFMFCLAGAMLTVVYWLPIWFQAVQGVSAVESGIRNIPMLLGLVVISIICGQIVQRTGWYNPFFFATPVVASIGAGLLTTFQVDTPSSKWIGYQALFGFGLGFGLQQTMLAVQNTMSKQDAPIGIATMFFANTLGGTIFISVGQAVLDNKLIKGLANVPGLKVAPSQIASSGAINLRSLVPPSELGLVLQIYNDAVVRGVFYIVVALSAATIFGALTIEWKKIQKPPKKAKPGKEEATEKADAANKV